MKLAPLFLAVLILGTASVFGATPTLSVFAGAYRPTVSEIHLADDHDNFVGGFYTNFKIKIKATGRGTAKALFHPPGGLAVVPVKIKVRLSKFQASGSKATAAITCVGNDSLVGFGSIDLAPPSPQRTIFFTFVKGSFHSFALFTTR